MKKILIISGASRGIGAATAEKFVTQGWQVINLSRSQPKNSHMQHISCDLSDPSALAPISEELKTAVDYAEQICVVHNAAGHASDRTQNTDAAVLEQVLAISLVTPSQLNKLLIPFMPKLSSIIYIGSTLSEKAVAGASSYIIAKHAVVGMMRASCQDLIDTGIHTCCICPGFTNTEMMREHQRHNPDVIEAIKNRVGAKRLIEPQEIAELIWFCSQNPVINGSVIHAHLGQIER